MPITAPRTSLDPATLDRQRRLLVDERALIIAQISESDRESQQWLSAETADVSFDEDGGEGGTRSTELERQAALRERLVGMLVEIDEAMGRIDAGTYGQCKDCGQPIGDGRLEAVPTARKCVRCKSAGPLRRRHP